eukprot:13675439-Heterocapsa_arctica.AAC.1
MGSEWLTEIMRAQGVEDGLVTTITPGTTILQFGSGGQVQASRYAKVPLTIRRGTATEQGIIFEGHIVPGHCPALMSL